MMIGGAVVWADVVSYELNDMETGSMRSAADVSWLPVVVEWHKYGLRHIVDTDALTTRLTNISNPNLFPFPMLFGNECVHANSCALNDICGCAETSVYQLNGNLFMAKIRNELCDKI